jgi:hypothetical protein
MDDQPSGLCTANQVHLQMEIADVHAELTSDVG